MSSEAKDNLSFMIKIEERKIGEWEKGIENDNGKYEPLLSLCYRQFLRVFRDMRIVCQHDKYRTINMFSRLIRNLEESKNSHALQIHKEILNKTPLSKQYLINMHIACITIPIKYHEDGTLISNDLMNHDFSEYCEIYDPVYWEFFVLFGAKLDLGMHSPEDFLDAIVCSLPENTFGTSDAYEIAARLTDITCLSYDALKFRPSIIAISCLWLACKMCDVEWPSVRLKSLPLNYSGKKCIKDCIDAILATLENVIEWRVYFDEDDVQFDKIACKISSWLFEAEVLKKCKSKDKK